MVGPSRVGLDAATGRSVRARLGWLVLGLLVVLLMVELAALTRERGVAHASVADTGAARSAALELRPPSPDLKVAATEIVAGPRVQSVAGGRATFLVVVDQTVTSEGSQTQPQLVRVGLVVTVQEKDHKVGSVRIL